MCSRSRHGSSTFIGRSVPLGVVIVLLAAGCATDGGEDSGGDGGATPVFSRPVTIVVPGGPGSGIDATARVAGPIMSDELRVDLPVVNTPGAVGSTGVTSMLTSDPGQSLAVLFQDALGAVALGSASFKREDITGVCRLRELPSGLWVKGDGPYASWEDFEAAASQGPLNVATLGQGSVDELTLAALAEEGVQTRPVPFADTGERITSVLGGNADAVYEQYSDVQDFVTAGELRPIVLFAEERIEGLEEDYLLGSDVGVEFLLPQYHGLIASSDADPEEIEALSEACAAAFQSEPFQDLQAGVGATQESFMDAEEFSRFLDENLAEITDLLEQYGVSQ